MFHKLEEKKENCLKSNRNFNKLIQKSSNFTATYILTEVNHLWTLKAARGKQKATENAGDDDGWWWWWCDDKNGYRWIYNQT